MAEAAREYSYRYRAQSSLTAIAGRPALELATSGGVAPNPRLYTARVLHPVLFADALLVIGAVARSRFFVPPAMLQHILLLADPVATVAADVVRFEAFSSCCSVYARLDLLPGFAEGEVLGTGTTNIDLGSGVRAALAGVTDADELGLEIGIRDIAVDINGDREVERKVPLPARWIRGFTEAQAILASMTPVLDVDGAGFRRLLQTLPRGAKRPIFVRQLGRQLTVQHREGESSVRVADPDRLRVLERVARNVRRARVFATREGASAWCIDLDGARMTIALSAEAWRGFSGEGNELAALAAPPSDRVLGRLEAALRWQSPLAPEALADSLGLAESEVHSGLATLATSGLVGYDVSDGSYFHRVLPFVESRVDRLQPRLKRARQLVADGAVQLDPVSADTGETIAWIRGRTAEYRVRIGPAVRACTCPWWGRHGGDRGPCAHILAACLVLNGGESVAEHHDA